MLFILLAAILVPVLSPYTYKGQSKALRQGPSWQHPFGTDKLGRDILVRVAANAGVPKFLAAHLAHLTCALWGWFDLDDTDVREAVKRTRVPVLLIHGEDDDFVPPEMSAEILSYNPTIMERHTFPGASHGISYVIDPGRYEELVTEFAARVL